MYEVATCKNAEELKNIINFRIQSGTFYLEGRDDLMHPVYRADVTIFRDNGLVFRNTCSAIYASSAWIYRGCKIYYEIEVVKNQSNNGCFSLGLINNYFLSPQYRGGEGNAHWWSPKSQLGITRYTIGVAIDILERKIWYNYGKGNGEPNIFFRLDDPFQESIGYHQVHYWSCY